MAKLSSLWFDTAERSARPALAEDLRVDVCVVGAGISGLSAAFELSRQGARVAVIEARHVAAGASGYNTAKLSSLHGLTYSRLERRPCHGSRFGARGEVIMGPAVSPLEPREL